MSGGPLFDQMGDVPRNSAAADAENLAGFVDFDVQPRRVDLHGLHALSHPTTRAGFCPSEVLVRAVSEYTPTASTTAREPIPLLIEQHGVNLVN